jgi:hypothetical protein
MRRGTDILVVDERDTPVAAIEVKNRANLSASEASGIRRNLFTHGLSGPVDYFLVVSQDVGYLWGPTKRDAVGVDPDLRFPMSPVVARYAVEPSASGRLMESQLELLVSSWIQELTGSMSPIEDEPELSLERAGLTSALRRGRVVTEAVL